MALKTQKVTIDFGLGLDEYTDPKLVKEGKLLRAENVVFNSAKKIQKRNGFESVSMLEVNTGTPIDEPREIFSHKRNPVVVSKNKLYTSTRSKLISDAIDWRDSEQFSFPTEVSTGPSSAWDTFGDRQYFEGDAAVSRKNLSLDSLTLATNDTLIKCTVYCSGEQGSVGVIVRDVNTDEVLASRDNVLIDDDDQGPWVNPRIIPWRSNGVDPDKFIIVVSEVLSAADISPTVGTGAYKIIVVTLDSMVGPQISGGMSLWNWIGITDPVLADFPDGGTSGLGSFRRRYSQSTDFLYDKESSVAWFVFGGTGVDAMGDLPTPTGNDWDIRWSQRVYVIKIEQGATTSGFTGGVHSKTSTILSDTHDNTIPAGFDSNIWEESFGDPNVIPAVPDIPQEPRWGTSGVSPYIPPTESDLVKRVQGYNFAEIFRVGATLSILRPSGAPSTQPWICIVCSSVCRDDLNTALIDTKQRTFLVGVDVENPNLSMIRTDLTSSDTNQITDDPSPFTPLDFVCTNVQYIEQYHANNEGNSKFNGYVVLYFEEQINNSFLRMSLFNASHEGGERRFFTILLTVVDWDATQVAPVPITDVIYGDVLPFTKPAARAKLILYGPEEIELIDDNRVYVVLPTVRKNISLMDVPIYSGDIYTLLYDATPTVINYSLGKALILKDPHTIIKAMDGTALAAASEPIYISNTYTEGSGFGSGLRTNRIDFDFPTRSSSFNVGIKSIETDTNPSIGALEYGNNLYTTGGFLKCWDGECYAENGFHFRPLVIDINNSGILNPVNPIDFEKKVWVPDLETTLAPRTGYYLTPTEDMGKEPEPLEVIFKESDNAESIFNPAYQFCFLYEWVDGNGEVHQSAPSEIIHLQVPTLYDDATPTPMEYVNKIGEAPEDNYEDPSLDLPGPMLSAPAVIRFRVSMIPPAFTDKNDVESICLKAYRTLNLSAPSEDAEAPGAVGEYFEDTAAAVQGSYLHKNLNVGGQTNWLTQLVTFSTPDSKVGKSNVLYTSFGDKPHVGSPACNVLAEHDGRLFALSSEDPYQIHYSNPRRIASATSFNMYGTIKVKQAGGPLVGMASNAGKLILFKESSVFVSFGSPVNASASSGGYSMPQEFSDSVGCSNSKSIAETTEGVFFQSGRDIYLIDKGYNLVKLGVNVSLEEGQNITSVIRKPETNEVRFCHNDGVIVYNTWFKQWTKSTLQSTGNSVIIDGNQYIIEKATKNILKENDSYYGDGEDPILMDIETAWIKLASSQGVQRIKNVLFLGELDAESEFDLDIFYDYNDVIAETISVTASDIASLDEWGSSTDWGSDAVWGGDDTDHVFQFRHKPKIQKCESIKFRIREKVLGDPNKGFALNTMLLEVGPKKGAMKLRSSKTI
jgi:hypothetical protein